MTEPVPGSDPLGIADLLHNIGNLFLKPEEAEQAPGDPALDATRIQLACDLLETIQGMTYLVPAIRHHRERWDGSGYGPRRSARWWKPSAGSTSARVRRASCSGSTTSASAERAKRLTPARRRPTRAPS